jgi:hypothetical protein
MWFIAVSRTLGRVGTVATLVIGGLFIVSGADHTL